MTDVISSNEAEATPDRVAHDNPQTSQKGDKGKKEKESYKGSKHPMLALQMIKTSSAIEKALERIKKRREWVRSRMPELKILFDSGSPSEKEKAFQEAESLRGSISKLEKAESQLLEKLPNIIEQEKANLAGLVFPEFEV